MQNEPKRWLDHSGNVNKIVVGLCVACALLLLIDLLDVMKVLYHKHVHFSFEHWFGFFGLYGLIACLGFVVVARVLRSIVWREDSYYDE